MLEIAPRDRRAERRAATRDEILRAAWEHVRADGLAALSLRELARTVGMQAPSLYSYFDSKHAIYDAMFAQGVAEFIEAQRSLMPLPDDPVAALTVLTRSFVEFCAADAARYQLMFQRPIPGFEPSPESFRRSADHLAEIVEVVRPFGVRTAEQFDLFTALGAGLAAQQMSNDPGGDRWIRRVDEAVEMFHAHITRTARPSRPTRRPR